MKTAGDWAGGSGMADAAVRDWARPPPEDGFT